jgi:glutathione S-transferase
MKLYYAKGACSLAIRIAVHETDARCDYESVDLSTKKTQSGQDYTQINPKGSVPALLLDNGQLLTEGAVIQQYLAETLKAAHLLPNVGEFQRYRVLEWLNFVATDLHKTVGVFFNPTIPQSVKTDSFKPLVEKRLQFLNTALQGNEFLTGKQYCLADGYCFTVLSWLPSTGIDLNTYPNVKRYFSSLLKRPTIQRACSEEGLSLG